MGADNSPLPFPTHAARRVLLCTAFVAAACSSRGVSTAELEQAAIAHARQTLSLGGDAKLTATVFVGKTVRGKRAMCGYVRGQRSDGRDIDPQEFIATTDPIDWVVFRSVHRPIIPAQSEMFTDWHTACGGPRGV
jgi:hypothetical protein